MKARALGLASWMENDETAARKQTVYFEVVGCGRVNFLYIQLFFRIARYKFDSRNLSHLADFGTSERGRALERRGCVTCIILVSGKGKQKRHESVFLTFEDEWTHGLQRFCAFAQESIRNVLSS